MPPFKLEVEFRGLCLFVVHPADGRVAVVMPDARATQNQFNPPDGKPGVRHVGYVSVDLPNLAGGPGGRGEVVHRFDGEQLEFVGVNAAAGGPPAFAVSDFGAFAPELELLAGALSAPVPPPQLLMRTVLPGGQLSSGPVSNVLAFDKPFGSDAISYGGTFAESVVWSAEVDDALALRITSWKGAPPTTLSVVPSADGKARVKVANLCADNPLQWKTLGGLSGIQGRDDDDFRWFYQLLQPKAGSSQPAFGPNVKLPVPLLERRSAARSNPPGCNPARISAPF